MLIQSFLVLLAQASHRQLDGPNDNGAYFTVVGPCTVDGACVRSLNYPSN